MSKAKKAARSKQQGKKNTPKKKAQPKRQCPHCKKKYVNLPAHVARAHKDKRGKGSDISDFGAFSFKHIDPTKVQNPRVLSQFVDWAALPPNARNPNTQKELAKKLGVDEDSLTNWKQLEGFWKEVEDRCKDETASRLPEVMKALVDSIVEDRSPRNIVTYLEYVQDWSKKLRIEDETPARNLTPEEQAEIKEKLKRWGKPQPVKK